MPGWIGRAIVGLSGAVLCLALTSPSGISPHKSSGLLTVQIKQHGKMGELLWHSQTFTSRALAKLASKLASLNRSWPQVVDLHTSAREHTHIHTRTLSHAHTQHTRARTHTRTHTTHTHTHAHTHADTPSHTHTQHTHTHAHTYICTHSHPVTHTRTHTQRVTHTETCPQYVTHTALLMSHTHKGIPTSTRIP